MGKSYRLPYCTFVGCRSSKWDKRFANRAVRRRQNEFVKACPDWDEVPFPHRYECAHNDVWDWCRDGKQQLQTTQHNYYNPFWLVGRQMPWSYEEMVEHRNESLEKHLRWIEELKRK